MIPAEIKQRFSAFQFYAVCILAVGLSVYLGVNLGNEQQAQHQQDIATLKQTLANLNQENNRLTKDLNVLGVELEVQRLAAQKAQQTIQQGMDREAELRQELNFYQKVMAPELKQESFVIDAFNIEPTLSEHFYRFDLVLMQQAKVKNVVKGNVDVVIKGSDQGKPKELRLLDLMEEGTTPLAFSFKYFQVLQGQFQLPATFQAEKVEIRTEIYQFRKKRGDLARTFDWQVNVNLADSDVESD